MRRCEACLTGKYEIAGEQNARYKLCGGCISQKVYYCGKVCQKGIYPPVISSHLKRIGLGMAGCLIRRTRSSVGRRNRLFEKTHKLLVESVVWRLGGWARLLSRSKIGVRTSKFTQSFSGDYFWAIISFVDENYPEAVHLCPTHSFSDSKAITSALLPFHFSHHTSSTKPTDVPEKGHFGPAIIDDDSATTLPIGR